MDVSTLTNKKVQEIRFVPNMLVQDFFTTERLIRDGGTDSARLCKRARRALLYGCYTFGFRHWIDGEFKYIQILTMEEFVEKVSVRDIKLRVPKLGEKCAAVVLKTLDAIGISLRSE
jgi:hypothetical protein